MWCNKQTSLYSGLLFVINIVSIFEYRDGFCSPHVRGASLRSVHVLLPGGPVPAARHGPSRVHR